MRKLLTHLAGSRLMRGIGANIYGQFVQVVIQLAAVPLLATQWGLTTYGVWLMLFTVPSYLALADFGFASAAANDMTMSITRGDRGHALSVFQGTRAVVVVIGILLMSLAAGCLYLFPNHWLDAAETVTDNHARPVVLLLIGYGLLSLQNSVSMAGFRATGAYATGTFLQVSILLCENMTAFVVVALGGGIGAAALAYFSLRLLGSGMLALVLKLREPWLMTLAWRSSYEDIRRLLAPALAVMTLPAAQALFLQGTVLTVGLAAGSAAVPAFTAVRTLSRVAVQLTGIVNHALMPEFTVAATRGDQARKGQLAFLSVITSAVVLLPTFAVVVFAGDMIIGLWTHGAIHPPFSLMLVLSIMMVINGIWHPISNLILALNRHATYSYFYLLAALAAVAASYPLIRLMGSTGAGVSLVLLDCVMFARVWSVARRLGIIDPGQLRKNFYDVRLQLWQIVRGNVRPFVQ